MSLWKNIQRFINFIKRPFFKEAKSLGPSITYSNVIQFDEMGYPLRLCIMIDKSGKIDQTWIDTIEQIGDVTLHWKDKEKSMNDYTYSDNYDDLFHSETVEYTPDYETMAHEAALAYFQNVKPPDLTPATYAETYLAIYRDILTKLQEE